VTHLSAQSLQLTPILVKDLGVLPYEDAWHRMRLFTDSRGKIANDNFDLDELWLLQHPPVFTQGQAGKAEHILKSLKIPIVQSDRGGQVTYHGPGQLIVYLLLNLKRKQISTRELVTAIENSVIALLASYGIEAFAKAEAPGVYIGEKKVASVGLRVRRGCSYHGVSINIAMDLSPFEAINPCGYPQLKMTQLADYLPAQPSEKLFSETQNRYVNCLLKQLKCENVNP
jgi:lipoyl(octanoyl) transferase